MQAERILILFLFFVAAISSEEATTVDVYAGPTDCDAPDRVRTGDTLGIRYAGTIDASSAAGEPGSQFASSGEGVAELAVGVGDLIEGWDAGLLGLCRGSRAVLVVPPSMAYGSVGVGDAVPGGATLRFDVEVVSLDRPGPPPDLFEELDVDRDGRLAAEEIHAHFRKESPDAPMPPDLIRNEDADGDGFVSREEFGGPRMSRDMCLEMLHQNSESTLLGLVTRWLCYRPHGPEQVEGHDNSESDYGNKEEL